MRYMSLAETKSHLSAVVDQVAAGEEIVITRRGRPVARIVAEKGGERPAPAKMAEELRAHLRAQPMGQTASVIALRETDRF